MHRSNFLETRLGLDLLCRELPPTGREEKLELHQVSLSLFRASSVMKRNSLERGMYIVVHFDIP